MKITKSYKFRLYPTEEQKTTLKQHGGNSRFVWNKLLEYSNAQYKITKKYPNQYELQKYILKLKQEKDFLKLGYSQPIQFNAQKLFKTFMRALKPEMVAERKKRIALALQEPDEEKRKKKLAKALNFGFPKFKAKNENNDNLFYPQHFQIRRRNISFPKIGRIQYIKHRKIEGKPLFCTIVQHGQNYFVSITSEVEILEKAKPELIKEVEANIVGADVGLGVFAMLSDKTTIENPRILKKFQKRLNRENKKLARMELVELKDTGRKTFDDKPIKKSSENRRKQLIKIQKINDKITNIRREFLFSFAHDIITKYDGIIVEDLDIQEMLKNGTKSMNRSILDVSWFEFSRILEYQCYWYGKYFCRVNTYFPSTQLCSKCGAKAKLSLKQRKYLCPCGNAMDRDLNASINIKVEGIKILRNAIGIESEKANTKNTKNTLATKGIKACGSTAIAVGKSQPLLAVGRKQEKLCSIKPTSKAARCTITSLCL